jgi:plastocyanin
MPRSTRTASAVVALTFSASLGLASCGGDSPSQPSPSPSPSPAPSPSPSPSPGGNTTITITAAGVSPRELVVARGARVTFVNNNTVGHDMNSDPHPQHTSCPDINVGFVATGQSRQTEVLNTARTCGYHDHNQPSNAALQGSIRIE